MPIEIAAFLEKTAEIAVEKAAEIGAKAVEAGTKAIDIGKRIDVTIEVDPNISKSVDITKRIVPNEIVGEALTSKQINELCSKGFSHGLIKDCTYQDGIYRLKTINQDLKGKVQPDTNVKYIEKTVEFYGNKIRGVFPKFQSVFDAVLPSDKIIATDDVQFRECNSQLKKALENDPKLRNMFSERQLKQIEAGKKPDGFTWNHNEEIGRMELVDAKIHDIAKHTGGKAIWSGGSLMR